MEEKSTVIGLTGQTGAGKTAASQILRELGCAVIDADQVSRQVVDGPNECLADLVLAFSVDIINDKGALDRKKLASIVFTDKAKLKRLNTIIFPYIVEEIERQLQLAQETSPIAVILDAPTLFESGADRLCHKTLSILADPEIRSARIMKRDSLTEEEANNRMSSQHPDQYYISRSDLTIRNDGDPIALRLELFAALDGLGISVPPQPIDN